MSLNKAFRYGPLPPSAKIRNYLQRVTSQNSTYSPGNTIQITVPACKNSYIDPRSLRLHFTVVNSSLTSGSASTSADIQGSASSFINQLRVYSGASAASLIEDVSYYGTLYQMLADTGVDSQQWIKQMSAVEGTSTSVVRYGATMSSTSGSTNSMNFSIPLLSFLSLLSDRNIPLHQGFTIYLTLEAANNCLFTSTTTNTLNYSVSNVNLYFQTLELDPQLDQALWASGNGAIRIPVTRWTGFRSTLASGSTSYQSLLSLSVSSLKTLLWGFTDTSQYNTVGYASINQRVNPGISQSYIQIAGTIIPNMKISSDTEAFVRVLESRNVLNTAYPGGLINYTNYFTTATSLGTQGTFTDGAYMQAYDMDVLTNTGDSLLSGVSCAGQQLLVFVTLSAARATALYQTSFAEYNALISFDPTGFATVSF